MFLSNFIKFYFRNCFSGIFFFFQILFLILFLCFLLEITNVNGLYIAIGKHMSYVIFYITGVARGFKC